MPTLKQQMEGLKQDTHPEEDGIPVDTYGYPETYNQAIDACIALLADHDQEAYKRGFIDGQLAK